LGLIQKLKLTQWHLLHMSCAGAVSGWAQLQQSTREVDERSRWVGQSFSGSRETETRLAGKTWASGQPCQQSTDPA